MMPAALDKGSQPYSYPLGGCEMAGKSNPPFKTLPLGKGHTQIAHVAYLKAGCILRGNLVPAISKHLKAFLYGWLPLSDAYRHYSH